MLYPKLLLVLGLAFSVVSDVKAAPQQLLENHLESPDSEYAANVSWDAAGFLGRIQMQIYTRGEKPTTVVELPQIKPSPANLTWITNDWVACESFVAERGAAFFYVNAPRKRGYMIEIFAPEKDGDWLISYTTNDSVSSDTIHTLSENRSSLFPILLRELPDDGLSYLSADFPYLLADAVDSFVQWRKDQKFKEMTFLSEMAENPKTGRLVVASVDETAEILYFPQGTTTTREMLALTKRQPLPADLQKIVTGIDPPQLSIEWTGDEGQFHILATRADDSTSVSEVLSGKFEGIKDTVYKGPGVDDLLQSKGESKDKGGDSESGKKSSSNKSSKKSTSKSKSSGKKSPSRSD